jgi:uncharacterized phiE125 gp8 family phage protein
MGLRVITPADVEPISLAEARTHLRDDAQYDSPYDTPLSELDDDLIQTLITAARQWAEEFTGRTIAQATLEYNLDAFPSGTEVADRVIELPGSPIQSLVSVGYTNADGAQTIDSADYQIDLVSNPPRLSPAVDVSAWPATTTMMNAVQVQYLAGYTLPTDSPNDYPLPKLMKQAILLVIGHWYANTEDGAPVKIQEIHLGAKSLLRNYRINKGMA